MIERANNDENSREFKIKQAELKYKPVLFPDSGLDKMLTEFSTLQKHQQHKSVLNSPQASFKYMTFKGRDSSLGAMPLENYSKILRQRNYVR